MSPRTRDKSRDISFSHSNIISMNQKSYEGGRNFDSEPALEVVTVSFEEFDLPVSTQKMQRIESPHYLGHYKYPSLEPFESTYHTIPPISRS
jgi:hypothetical protein